MYKNALYTPSSDVMVPAAARLRQQTGPFYRCRHDVMVAMAALHSRREHYILQLCLLSFFFLLFFLTYSQQSQIGCPHIMWSSTNFMSEICCMRPAANAGCKNYAKLPSVDHHTTLSGYIFATKACIHSLKNLVKQQYLLLASSQYGEFQPTNG